MSLLAGSLKEIKLEVTQRCPLVCLHCSSEASPKASREMNPESCMRILDQAGRLGVEQVAFSGGEPLLWSSLPDAVARGASLGMAVAIYTSGNVAAVEDQLGALKQVGLGKAIFSLYAPAASSHDRVTRVAGSFAFTSEAISRSAELGLATELHVVALSHTYRELPEIVHVGEALGATRTSVLRFVPQGRGELIASAALARLQSLELRSMVQLLREDGHDVRLGTPWNYLMLGEEASCPAADDRLVISPDLETFPCDAFKQIRPADLIGTDELWRLDGNDLEDVWLHSPFLEAVRSTRFSQPSGACADCSDRRRCGSGCLAQRAVAAGRLTMSPDPGCLRDQREVGSAQP